MSIEHKYDYIIAGGGIAGSVLARRLADKYPSVSILLVEAGGRPEGHPLIDPPMACLAAANSELDWAYTTVPQKSLGGRAIHQAAGMYTPTMEFHTEVPPRKGAQRRIRYQLWYLDQGICR